jgi:hypothetical protein
MTARLPWPQTRYSMPRRNSILPLSIQTICSFGVTVRLDMNAGPDAPPNKYPSVAGENAAADLFADLLPQAGRRTGYGPSVGMPPQVRIFLLPEGAENVKVRELRN